MPFQVFSPRGGASPLPTNFPFQVSIANTLSGIAATSFGLKCPCDTGTAGYSSKYFFMSGAAGLPDTMASGVPAFTVYSGSQLYKSYDVGASGYQFSYAFANPTLSCDQATTSPAVIIYGLNSPVFIDGFFKNPQNQNLNIWLTVCFPKGETETQAQNAFTSQINAQPCLDCTQRDNVPLVAFISCGVTGFPQAIVTELVNKGTDSVPRFEKRQIAANIPIAIINSSGTITRQLADNNLMLTDMCIQGIPAKIPLTTFSNNG